jgi:hypothetical protein
MSDSECQREIERCQREIAKMEALLRSGHPDVEGLCQALADWNAERRLLEDEKRRRAQDPAAEVRGDSAHLRRP